MRDALDGIVAAKSDHRPQCVLVVGVLRRGQRSLFTYGSSPPETPSEGAIFEIGSVSKVFTTSLLSILTAEGVVSPDQAVRDLAPELGAFPREITLERLATHTAGLPKMPSNMIRSMLRDRGNPYANYTTEDLFRYLVGHPPGAARTRKAHVEYSNLSLGLLGHLLARKAGLSYGDMVGSRIAAPLALKDTAVDLSSEQKARLAPPHRAGGKPGQTWDLPAFEGAGGLKSTAEDLVTFLAANLGSGPAGLVKAFQACHDVRTEAFAPPGLLQWLASRRAGQDPGRDPTRQGMALGWTVGRLPSGAAQVHWHHGATGGYRAFVGFLRTEKAGVVVLANSGPSIVDGLSGTTATDRIGFEALGALLAS